MKPRLLLYITTCCLLLQLSACRKKKLAVPADYDLGRPEKFIMSENLLEISGFCFYKGNADTVYAIQDEDGKVFKMAWGVKKTYPVKFSKKNDYEDVAMLGDQLYILRSDGIIFSFNKNATTVDDLQVKEWKDIVPKSEYEGLYADETTQQLYLLCKKCAEDDNRKKLTGYIIDTQNGLSSSYSFSIDVTKINATGKQLQSGFKPSALSRNPITNEWFVLSGSNKLLVIADSAWNVKESYRLDGNIFNQAEGINFDNSGNLYISNEGEEDRNGNILLFKRKKVARQ